MDTNGADPAGGDHRNDLPFGHKSIDDIPFTDDGPPCDPRENWDAGDERRQRDQFAPPKEPCECYCLHCQRTFMSDQIWLQRVKNARDGFEGFWMCPTNNCSGAGFTFDIFPTDPDHPANAGWFDDDDDGDGDAYDADEDEDFEEALDPDDVGGGAEAIAEYDPAESKYKQLDEEMGDAADDIGEGDEWKLGVAPGERVPPQTYWSDNARREWEKEQADYNAPDRRPREIDYGEREPRNSGEGPEFREDDIPF